LLIFERPAISSRVASAYSCSRVRSPPERRVLAPERDEPELREPELRELEPELDRDVVALRPRELPADFADEERVPVERLPPELVPARLELLLLAERLPPELLLPERVLLERLELELLFVDRPPLEPPPVVERLAVERALLERLPVDDDFVLPERVDEVRPLERPDVDDRLPAADLLPLRRFRRSRAGGPAHARGRALPAGRRALAAVVAFVFVAPEQLLGHAAASVLLVLLHVDLLVVGWGKLSLQRLSHSGLPETEWASRVYGAGCNAPGPCHLRRWRARSRSREEEGR
jgi:hypothetical protein